MGSVASEIVQQLPPEEIVFGQTEAMRAIQGKLQKAAGTGIPVLLEGECGTGKDLLARFLHQQSPWSSGPLIKVRCPGVAGGLFERELLRENGTSNLAAADMVERQGTLLLDEIDELEPAMQSRLLHLLQEDQLCRANLNGREFAMRLVCSGHRDLKAAVDAGRFRPDLYYRIHVLSLHLPALRERSVDIPELVTYFLGMYGTKYNIDPPPLSARLMRSLKEYHWPGNLRELENLVRRYVIVGGEESIAEELSRRAPHPSGPQIPADGIVSLKKITRQAVRELEREVILRSLQTHNWNRKRVARALGISYRALLYKIKYAEIASPRTVSIPTEAVGVDKAA